MAFTRYHSMITKCKINKAEEIDLLHHVVVGITKRLKKPINFFYREAQTVDFAVDLEDDLKKGIKELLPEKVYNTMLMAATIHNNPICTAIIASTGYEVTEKLAHSLFYLQEGVVKNPISMTIQQENNISYDYNQKIEHYLGVETDQRNLVKQVLLQQGIIGSN